MELTGYIEIHIQLISRIMKKDLNFKIGEKGSNIHISLYTVKYSKNEATSIPKIVKLGKKGSNFPNSLYRVKYIKNKATRIHKILKLGKKKGIFSYFI